MKIITYREGDYYNIAIEVEAFGTFMCLMHWSSALKVEHAAAMLRDDIKEETGFMPSIVMRHKK